MADPISIAATAGSVFKLAYGCSTSLYTFISNTKNVNANINDLHREADLLSQTARTVESTLQSPGLATFQNADLWADASGSLAACESSLIKLEKSLPRRSAATPSRNPFSRVMSQFALGLNDEQIKSSRAQLHSHRLALQLVAQMISIHISSMGPPIILAEINPRLQNLENLIALIQADNGDLARRRIREGGPMDDLESVLLLTNTHLATAAQELLSQVGSDTRSTIFGGTEENLDFASQSAGGVPLRSKTVPPIMDAPNENFSRISGWVSSSGSGSTDNNYLSDETITTENTNYIVPRPQYRLPHGVNETYDEDDEDEIGLDLTHQYVRLARTSMIERDYPRAEKFFQKALVQPELLPKLEEPVSEERLQQELVSCLLSMQKYSNAREICEQLIGIKINNDADRNQVLDAAYTLAQIHLAEGSFDQAISRCREAMQGRRRLDGRGDSYHSTVALMAAIQKARGDDQESDACRAILPESFSIPSFATSDAASTKTGSSSVALPPSLPTRVSEKIEPRLTRKEVIYFLSKVTRDENYYLTVERLPESMDSIHWAAAQRDMRRMQRILARGEGIDAVKAPRNLTPLHFATIFQHKSIVTYLLQQGANVNARDRFSWTPLHWTSFLSGDSCDALAQEAIARTLISNDAEVNALNSSKQTPLHGAAGADREAICTLLLQEGANIEATNIYGRTPLYEAVLSGHESTIRLLLEKGANIDATGNDGWTPLHSTANSGDESMVRLLLDAGADKQRKDRSGKTPLDLAKMFMCKNIVRLLQ